jgi:hypothetical protein
VSFGSGGPKKTAMVAALRPPEKPLPYPIRQHPTIPARRFSTGCKVLGSSRVRSVLIGLFVGLYAPVRWGLEVGREYSGSVSVSFFQLLLGEVLHFYEAPSQ